MSVEIKDNTAEVLEAIKKAKKAALTAIGNEAEGFAKSDPNMPVKTGRARNSITWATKEKEGQSFSYSDNEGKSFSDNIGTGAEEDSVYVGSNVEYFPIIENGGVGRAGYHILRNAVSQHKDRYGELVKQAFAAID